MAESKSHPFDKVAYDRQYSKDHYTRVSVVLNKETDKKIIMHLDTKKSKSDYIKRLILEDMDQ